MFVAILTKNRTASLRKCLSSLNSNVKGYGREIELFVADDSSDPATIAENRLVLRQSGLSFSHFDRNFREGFSRRLATQASVPLEDVRFAILPDDDVAMGAVRNFFTLLLAGQQFVMLDDDMECKFASVPERSNKVRYSLGPTIKFNENYVPEEPTFQQEDFIAQHQQLFAMGAALTVGGAIGDSGIENSYVHLGDKNLVHRIKTPEQMNTLMRRRQLLRVSSNPCLTKWICCTGMSMGVDTGSIVPPFLPVQRSEDILFGLMLQNCLGKNSAYCNYAMLHTPNRVANLEEGLRTIAFPNLGDFVTKVLGWLNPQSLEGFGQDLRDLSYLPNFFELADTQITRWRGRFLKVLNAVRPGLPEFLLQEMDKVEAAIKESAPYQAPVELTPDEFRTRVRQFGELLLVWPALYVAARKLNG